MPTLDDAVHDHYEARWGKHSWVFPLQNREGNTIYVDKWAIDASGTDQGVAWYATIGGSRQPMEGGRHPTHRMELFIGLIPAQDGVVEALASLAYYPIRYHTFLDDGHTVPGDGPLWPGTRMTDCLMMSQDILPPLAWEDKVHVDFLQVVPLYRSELEFKKQHGAAALWERWRRSRVPFWKSDRPPAPGFG